MVALSEEDSREALHLKLIEESGELQDASDESRLEELADVYEVVSALARAYGHSLEDVVTAAASKRHERGGFDSGTWMSLTP